MNKDGLTPIERIYKAKISLFHDKPFFAYVLMAMKLVEDNNLPMPTMGVDIKGNLYYDSKFVDSLPLNELSGVLAHECLHVVLNHMARINGRDTMTFNIANDLKVNDILINEGMALPKGGILPQQHSFTFPTFTISKIDEKTSEEIYDEIKHFASQSKTSLDEYDKQRFDNHMLSDGTGKNEIDGLTKEQIEVEKKKWKKILVEAAQHAKQRG